MNISHSTTGSLSAQLLEKKRLQIAKRFKQALRKSSARKRFVRYGLIGANLLVLGAVVAVVGLNSHGTSHTSAASAIASRQASINPVDGLTSYDIAANVARMTSLPEQTAVTNQAQSAKVAIAVSASDTNVALKPQLVATALKSRNDIKTYVAVAGDTVSVIAQKFGVTSDSIKWSNGLTGDTVELGAKITIPPVNGIVYTVKSGDTVQTLAAKYKANADQITAYNDAELGGLVVGQQIIIPNGQVQQVVAAARTYSGLSASGFTAVYGGNGYDFGYCTYYAAGRSGAPSNWGNANTWAYYAAASGWTVSSAPRVGAIAQTSRGYLGHVAIVEAVSADGSQIKYSDMNGISGWGRVGYSDWVSSGYFEHYIYR